MQAMISVFGLLLLLHSGCNCGERPIEEHVEPDLRIEPLCEVHCSRLMDCAYEYVGTVSFTDEEGCRQSCVDDVVWERSCAEKKQALFECMQEFECPEFSEFYTAPREERPCGAAQTAYSACLPGEPR